MSKPVFLFVAMLLAAVSTNLHGQSNNCFSGVTNFSVDFAPQAIVSADFNSDGKVDLATANVGTNNVSVLIGTGTGSFSPAVTYMAANGLYAMTCADFNGDGKLDLATVNGGGYQLLFGTGSGSFAFPTGQGTAWGPEDIVSGDFNGDGKPDLAIVNTIQGKNVGVLINNGNGTFATEVTYSALGSFHIAAGDFNGDGKLDLAVGRAGQSLQCDFSVLYGTGTGSFNTAVNYYQNGTDVTGITAVDFNNDGKTDIAMTGYNSSDVFVRLAGSTGSFVPGVNYPVGTGARQISTADFNNDGKLDLAVGNYSSSNVSVLHGTGTGSFGPTTTYSIGANPTDITAADFNGDGKPDLAASVDYYSAAVLLNTASSLSLVASSTTFCAGGTATLSVSGATTYTWSGGPTTSSYTVNPSVTTTYSVSGINSAGCTSNASLKITVKPLPTITLSSSNTPLCSGDSSAISAFGASTYTWNTGAQTQSISFIASTASGFSVTGTSTLTGCSASATSQLNVSDCTGITDFTISDLQIIIFPNPSMDKLELRFDNTLIENVELINLKIEIVDAFGKLVKNYTFSQGSSVIDISLLNSGVYFLRINDHVQKFVKE